MPLCHSFWKCSTAECLSSAFFSSLRPLMHSSILFSTVVLDFSPPSFFCTTQSPWTATTCASRNGNLCSWLLSINYSLLKKVRLSALKSTATLLHRLIWSSLSSSSVFFGFHSLLFGNPSFATINCSPIKCISMFCSTITKIFQRCSNPFSKPYRTSMLKVISSFDIPRSSTLEKFHLAYPQVKPILMLSANKLSSLFHKGS